MQEELHKLEHVFNARENYSLRLLLILIPTIVFFMTLMFLGGMRSRNNIAVRDFQPTVLGVQADE